MAVPFAELYKWVQKIEDPEVEVKIKDNTLYADTATASCKIKGMDADQYPVSFPSDTLPIGTNLKLHLQRALRSAPRADSVFLTLSGVNFVSNGKTLKINAADSIQACSIIIDVQLPAFNVTVPVAAVNALIPFLEFPVELGVQEGSLLTIKGDGFDFTSQLLGSKFPEVERMIPESTMSEIIFDGKELKTAIQQTLVFANVNYIQAEIGLSDTFLASKNINTGAESSVEVLESSGPRIKVGFNGSMLVNKLEAGEVRLGFNRNTEPILITYPDDDSYRAVIMPMALR